jgi:large subunit ribosomal protein L18
MGGIKKMKRIAKRRRREGKTNYLVRLKLLKGGKPRLVFRKSNKFALAQYVTSEAAQDKIVMTLNSKELLKCGWPEKSKGSLKSIPASYLTGYLMGKKIQDKKLETPIVDLGMQKTSYKTKVYSFIKGLIDSGLEIQCKEEAFPEQERIEGKNLKEDFSKTFSEIKSKIEGSK